MYIMQMYAAQWVSLVTSQKSITLPPHWLSATRAGPQGVGAAAPVAPVPLLFAKSFSNRYPER